MNTVGDILKLADQGYRTLVATGAGMTEAKSHFDKRISELITSAFVSFCILPSKKGLIKRSELPAQQEMCVRLGGLDQTMILRRQAQADYYCAIAVLLTMDGHTEDDVLVQHVRAESLINSGLLSSLQRAS